MSLDVKNLDGKLSSSTMAALLAHLGKDDATTTNSDTQKAANANKITKSQEAKINATQNLDVEKFLHDNNTNAGVDEDFGLSQFWYTTETAQTLAKEALTCGGTAKDIAGVKRIAFVSCPSAFKAALDMGYDEDEFELFVFEYDTRFGDVYGDKFVFFDFNSPYIHEDFVGVFDFVIADPPYLTDDCMKKTLKHMKALARDENTPMGFATGTVMAGDIYQAAGLRESKFHPEHTNKLGNEFSYFCNYEVPHLGGFYPLEDLEKDFLPQYYKVKREEKLQQQQHEQEEQNKP